MEIVVVKYGNKNANNNKIKNWCSKLGCNNPTIINNKLPILNNDEVKGDNSFFEFSGYSIATTYFKKNGPYIIVNDTLFTHHIPVFWRWILSNAKRVDPDSLSVWGDHRKEKIFFPEKSKIFLASWIFYIPNRKSLAIFQSSLGAAIASADQKVSLPYQRYIDKWLLNSTVFRGWNGCLDNKSYKRKSLTIKLEHRLSIELSHYGVLKSLGKLSNLYFGVRLVERIKNRFELIIKLY
jgi:hypothetical protein